MKYHAMNHRSGTVTINWCEYTGQFVNLRKTENHFVKLSSLNTLIKLISKNKIY